MFIIGIKSVDRILYRFYIIIKYVHNARMQCGLGLFYFVCYI